MELAALLIVVARWACEGYRQRRKVRLTVHRAHGYYCITVVNASRDRDAVVMDLWLNTAPPIQLVDPALPIRLKHSEVWETRIPVANIPAQTTDVEWLARCRLSPDDKVVKSRPRRNVPPFGAVPRG